MWEESVPTMSFKGSRNRRLMSSWTKIPGVTGRGDVGLILHHDAKNNVLPADHLDCSPSCAPSVWSRITSGQTSGPTWGWKSNTKEAPPHLGKIETVPFKSQTNITLADQTWRIFQWIRAARHVLPRENSFFFFFSVLESHRSTNRPLTSNHGNKDNVLTTNTGLHVCQQSRFPLTTQKKKVLSLNADTVSSDTEINIGRLNSIVLAAQRQEV